MGDKTTTTDAVDPESATSIDEGARKVVQRYEKLVYKIAHRLRQKLPDEVEFDDLIGWGYTGLLEAYHRFDESKNTRFATFAYYRIRGAMLDACPRPIVDPKRKVTEVGCNEVLNTYAHVVQHQGGQSGVEDRLSMLSDVTGSMLMVFVLRDCPSQSLKTDGAPHKRKLARRQTAQKVRSLLDRLPENEQIVLTRMYFEERSMTEIGDQLGYSPSWVSRIHARALKRLRRFIEQEDELGDLRHAIPI